VVVHYIVCETVVVHYIVFWGVNVCFLPVEALHLSGAEQPALPLLGQALEALPGGVDLVLLAHDELDLGVGLLGQLGRQLVDLVDALLVGRQVRLELLKLLLQQLHVLQVLAQLLRGGHGLLDCGPDSTQAFVDLYIFRFVNNVIDGFIVNTTCDTYLGFQEHI